MTTPAEVSSAIVAVTNSKQAALDAQADLVVKTQAEADAMAAKTASEAALTAATDQLATDRTAAIAAINAAFA